MYLFINLNNNLHLIDENKQNKDKKEKKNSNYIKIYNLDTI